MHILSQNSAQCTEMYFFSFHPLDLSTTMAVINPPERNLAKCTSVQCTAIPVAKAICITFATLEINKINHLRISISKLFFFFLLKDLTNGYKYFDINEINEILLVYGSFSSFVSSHYHDTVTYYVKGRRGLSKHNGDRILLKLHRHFCFSKI